MQPDILDDIFGFRSASRPPGEEPDELRTMRREHCRKPGRLKTFRVGYGIAPNFRNRHGYRVSRRLSLPKDGGASHRLRDRVTTRHSSTIATAINRKIAAIGAR